MATKRLRVFGMVSTEASLDYTTIALDSFVEKTALDEGDVFYLIDNDGSYSNHIVPPPLVRITNRLPRSYATNANHIFRLAQDHLRHYSEQHHGIVTADVFLLNNDLLFTTDWIAPLLEIEDAIVSPMSNREQQYQMYGLTLDRTVQEADVAKNHHDSVDLIAKHHRDLQQPPRQVLWLPFFCIKIPLEVYRMLGPLDEQFGRGGGEDNDYCVRATLAGVPIVYASTSYILHFNGKSTWDGAESPDATELRCQLFRERFTNKWGHELMRLLIDHDFSILQRIPTLGQLLQEGRSREALLQLLARRSS